MSTCEGGVAARVGSGRSEALAVQLEAMAFQHLQRVLLTPRVPSPRR